MMSNHNIGLCIWVGEDRFVTFNVDVQNPEIAATFNDIRGYMSFTVPIYTYAIEFTREFKVYTAYRPVNDMQGRPTFLAVTLFVPNNVLVSEITPLLERLSQSYYKNHYGFGGILKQEAQLIPELYSRELDNVRAITEPDGSWVGRASSQIGKPKILPFSDVKVVEQFFQHPHRTSFHQCQEVLFVPHSYLNGTSSGISLPRSTPDDFFALDGADVGMEAIGFQIEKTPTDYSIKDFHFNSIAQDYWVPFLRPSSVISFTLSKGKYYEDFHFEGSLTSAISKGYLNDTLQGYSFAENIPFTLRKKVVTFVFPSLEQSVVFALTLIASGNQTKRRPISGGRTEIIFSGEELGALWSFLIEENGYEYVLGQGIPDSMEAVWTDKGSRLYKITDLSGKDICLDFGISSPVKMSKGARRSSLSGEWTLPSTLSPDSFVLEHNKYFEKNIIGIESGSVSIILDRIGYELCIPEAFWSALSGEQKSLAAFKLGDSSWTFASRPEGGMIVVADQMIARDGRFSTFLQGKELGFDFDTRTDENKDRFYIRPRSVELDVAADCIVSLRNGTNLSGIRVVVPQSEVDLEAFKAQGYTVQRVGKEDNEDGSFLQYGVTKPGARNQMVTGTVLDNNQGTSTLKQHEMQYFFYDEKWTCSKLDEKNGFILAKQGMYLACPFNLLETKKHKKNKDFIIEEGRGDDGRPCYSVKMREGQAGSRNKGKKSWMLYGLLGIALLCIIGGVVLFILKPWAKAENEPTITFLLEERPKVPVKILNTSNDEGLIINGNTISYVFNEKNPQGIVNVDLHVDNVGYFEIDVTLDINDKSFKKEIILPQSTEGINTIDRKDKEGVQKFIDSYHSEYIKDYLRTTFKADSLIYVIYSMDCCNETLDKLGELLEKYGERAEIICSHCSSPNGVLSPSEGVSNFIFIQKLASFHADVFSKNLTVSEYKEGAQAHYFSEDQGEVIRHCFDNQLDNEKKKMSSIDKYKRLNFKAMTYTQIKEALETQNKPEEGPKSESNSSSRAGDGNNGFDPTTKDPGLINL